MIIEHYNSWQNIQVYHFLLNFNVKFITAYNHIQGYNIYHFSYCIWELQLHIRITIVCNYITGYKLIQQYICEGKVSVLQTSEYVV